MSTITLDFSLMTVWELGDTFAGVMSEMVLVAILDWLRERVEKS